MRSRADMGATLLILAGLALLLSGPWQERRRPKRRRLRSAYRASPVAAMVV